MTTGAWYAGTAPSRPYTPEGGRLTHFGADPRPGLQSLANSAERMNAGTHGRPVVCGGVTGASQTSQGL